MVVKILLSGDVAGNLPALSKRAAAVNKSSGPFDVLFCAGGFFPPTGTFFYLSKDLPALRSSMLTRLA